MKRDLLTPTDYALLVEVLDFAARHLREVAAAHVGIPIATRLLHTATQADTLRTKIQERTL